MVDATEGKILKVSRGSELRNICIGNVELRKTDQNKVVCEIDFKIYEHLTNAELNNVRVHVLATNYLSPCI